MLLQWSSLELMKAWVSLSWEKDVLIMFSRCSLKESVKWRMITRLLTTDEGMTTFILPRTRDFALGYFQDV